MSIPHDIEKRRVTTGTDPEPDPQVNGLIPLPPQVPRLARLTPLGLPVPRPRRGGVKAIGIRRIPWEGRGMLSAEASRYRHDDGEGACMLMATGDYHSAWRGRQP